MAGTLTRSKKAYSEGSDTIELAAVPGSGMCQVVAESLPDAGATGSVTIQVKAGTSQSWSDVEDNVLSLDTPIAVIIEGRISGVRAVRSGGSGEWSLEVIT